MSDNELRELIKTEMFAAIEYGRLNNEVTQNALEASWYDHLNDIMEYVAEDRATLLRKVAESDELAERNLKYFDKYLESNRVAVNEAKAAVRAYLLGLAEGKSK